MISPYDTLPDAVVSECDDATEEDSGPIKADRCLPSRRFRFNRAEGACQDFVQYGCGRNRNSFSSAQECEARCAVAAVASAGRSAECDLPVKVGMCRARLRRFYYDQGSATCKQFWFGGCDGNGNNFQNENECIAKCVPQDKIPR